MKLTTASAIKGAFCCPSLIAVDNYPALGKSWEEMKSMFYSTEHIIQADDFKVMLEMLLETKSQIRILDS